MKKINPHRLKREVTNPIPWHILWGSTPSFLAPPRPASIRVLSSAPGIPSASPPPQTSHPTLPPRLETSCLSRRDTHHQVADDDSGQEERDTGPVADQHAVPHTLDPLSAQHSEHDHEGVHEIYEVPARQLAVGARLEATHVVWKKKRKVVLRDGRGAIFLFLFCFCFVVFLDSFFRDDRRATFYV